MAVTKVLPCLSEYGSDNQNLLNLGIKYLV